MGTVLQDKTRHNHHNHPPPSTNRAKRKGSGPNLSQTNMTSDVSQNAEEDTEKDSSATENGLNTREMRTTSTAALLHPREILSKPKYKVSSIKNRPVERCNRQTKNTMLSCLPPVPPPRQESTARVTHEDTDSGSDVSDTERVLQPAFTANPPLLHLREEVVDPSDFQPSRAPPRSHAISRDSYPDFLPPPFNSWSLRELAVYLNTDGKNIPRSKPVNQFERYLDRLLQLEWRQILTLQEETSKSTRNVRRREHSSLSAPKTILQCQRAFPFTLLSSVYPQSCNRHAVSVCTYPQHSHRLVERSGLSRRSSSETRAQHLNRLSDSSLDHLKRMQAIGNIRNPITHNPHVSSPTWLDPSRRKKSGGRSRSCGDESKDGSRRTRLERRTIDTILEKEPVIRRISAKHKHVEFVFQEKVMT